MANKNFKKKMRVLKNHAVRQINQIREGKYSLQVKMLFILSVFAVTIVIANVIIVNVGSNMIFDTHFRNQLSECSDGLKKEILMDNQRIEGWLDEVTQNADPDSTIRMIAARYKVAGCHGYIVVQNDGSLLSTSYESVADTASDESAEESLSKAVKLLKDGKFNGIVRLLNNGYCSAVAKRLGSDGSRYGKVLFVVTHSLYDTIYLDELKRKHMTDITLFEGEIRKATTMFDVDGNRMTGTRLVNEEASNTVYRAGETYRGMADIGGNDMYVEYVPIKNYNGYTEGIFYTGINANIGRHLKGNITLAMFLGSVVVCVFVIIFCFMYVRRKITEPVRYIAHEARRIASRDLTRPITRLKSDDELEFLCVSMEQMRASLHKTIEEVVETAAILQASSDKLSEASMALSDGANHQAGACDKISSSVGVMISSIDQNKSNSNRTNDMVAEANDSIGSICQTAQENIDASTHISEAIDNINSLVNQTNILALNASVEAARAGDMGKGFAVVAREVGRLAEQTRDTAIEISRIANVSITGAETINVKINEVKPQLEQIVQLMREVAASSGEQSVGAANINNAIIDLNSTTQQAAANAEELAANAEELANSADHLHDVVKRFKI